MADFYVPGSGSLREQEEAGVEPKVANHKTMTRAQRKDNRNFNRQVLQTFFKAKNLKKKSALATLLLVLFGGGGFLTVFMSPSLAIIQMKEVFTKNLNEQLHSVDERSSVLLRSKLKDLTSGSCGAIKIRCKFQTISAKQVEKFKAAGIDVETSPDKKWYNGNRGQITKISFTDDKGVKTEIKDAATLQKTLLRADATPFRAAMLKGYNPLFASVSDKLATSVMSKLKITKSSKITGETDEERQKRVNDVVSGIDDSSAKTVTVKTDKDGNEHYYDSDGNELTKEEYEAGKAQAERSENYEKTGGTRGVFSSVVKGASIISYMDSACTVYNSLRHMVALAKTVQEAQAARFAMTMVLTPADMSKVGDISADQVNFVGNNLTATRPASNVVDESKLNQQGSANQPPTTTDPEAGMNAFDSPGYHMAAYGDAPDLSLRASQYMIGGGPTGLFSNLLDGVAKVVTFGNSDPTAVNTACGYIQNPVVRFAGLGIGIVAGIGTFGLSTALGVGGSLAFAMMLPYIESHGADILAGNVFKNITGIDSGDAAAVGTAALFGSIAKARGLKPLTAAEGKKYAVANQESYARYADAEAYLARATPFDISNPYSFMGSIAATMVPVAQQSKSSISAAMINLTNLIPTSFASLTGTASAASATRADDYYDKCDDIGYKQLGLGANVFCQLSYGLSDEELAMDPLENVDWMVANKQINPDSGEALPEGGDVPSSDWTYAKFLKECPNRTTGYGENEDENEGNGFNCIDPAKEEKNKHFRIYTLDKSVDDSLDGDFAETAATSDSSNTANGKNVVTADGWTFPTVATDTITSGFETNERPDHHGVDIAGDTADKTLNQPIYAARDGKVIAAGPADGYGNWIVIEHDVSGQKYTTVYGHMFDDGVMVKVGDTVKAGQQIGKIGSNGESTGPHLHFELWSGSPLTTGKPIDPTSIVEATKKANGVVSV